MADLPTRRAVAAVASLLDYPSRPWRRRLRRWTARVGVLPAPVEGPLRGFAREVRGKPLSQLQAHYVATFDFSRPCALYLTAHEYGDDRRRGRALLALNQELARAGYAPRDGELPDFLPLLLEFWAVGGASADPLGPRLRAVVDRLAEALEAQGSPYRWLAWALQGALPAAAAPLPPLGPAGSEEEEPVPFPLHLAADA